jgi:hypothetical protein
LARNLATPCFGREPKARVVTKAKKWKVHHFDVKTIILKGHLQEEVFMQQPQGNEKLGFISLACKLNHALYGFK